MTRITNILSTAVDENRTARSLNPQPSFSYLLRFSLLSFSPSHSLRSPFFLLCNPIQPPSPSSANPSPSILRFSLLSFSPSHSLRFPFLSSANPIQPPPPSSANPSPYLLRFSLLSSYRPHHPSRRRPHLSLIIKAQLSISRLLLVCSVNLGLLLPDYFPAAFRAKIGSVLVVISS